MYLVDCLNTLIWFCMISQVYVDLVEDRSCTNSYLVSLKALAGNIWCFQCQELVYYFHKTEPKGDGAILIFLPGDILCGAPCFFVCSRLCPGSGWGDITKTYIRLYQSGLTMLLSKWKWHEKNKDEAWMKSVSILDVWVSVWVTVFWTRDQLVNFPSISVQVRTTNSSRCTLWWRPNSSTRRLSVHQKAPERPVEKTILRFFHNSLTNVCIATHQNVVNRALLQVVLSTNIAEASVTIDDVVYVIDTGVRKERSYDAGDFTSCRVWTT